MGIELLPTKARFSATETAAVEVRNLTGPSALQLVHLGTVVAERPVVSDGIVELGVLPPGGYGLRCGGARTAVEVWDASQPEVSMRYGFIASYRPDKELAVVADNMRRLHLTDMQFYDWGYRHADLNGGGEQYDDALGQPISLGTVRQLTRMARRVGSRSLGYAAVYGVGHDEWHHWRSAALLQANGQTYGLGDFLSLVDPGDRAWQAHFSADLRQASRELGFDGFHLDQYGYPKLAVLPTGERVDLADSFDSLIRAVRDVLPNSRLVFNNVNDFPTWRTVTSPQDVTYVEVWPPHVGLEHLAAVVERARGLDPVRPVVIAAYQHVYEEAAAEQADLSTAFTMATLFSHGATQLLCGEQDRILTDPYYVRNHAAESSTRDLLHRWYDFMVEQGELFFGPDWADVTGAVSGGYNGDIDVSYASASTPGESAVKLAGPGPTAAVGAAAVRHPSSVVVSGQAQAGAVWRRVTNHGSRYVVHLINLTNQVDTHWDAPRQPVTDLVGGTLTVRQVGSALPRVQVGDPDSPASLQDCVVTAEDGLVTAYLPPLHVWQVILVTY